MNYDFKNEVFMENGHVVAKIYRYRKTFFSTTLDKEFTLNEKDCYQLYTSGGPVHAPDEESRPAILSAFRLIRSLKMDKEIPLDCPELSRS